ncbi:DUF86 domain-containing protein [bacterium]|nr:DUF86 domain-containing protein [bacterium]MBU3955433.1 DUF86 domain-containing protein [bacterium]MBU4133836.1 DUF86 domain-containing protein [bacterium]
MKDDKFFIRSVLENLDKIQKFIEGFSYAEFKKDNKTQYAVFKAFENIGEAVKNISANLRQRYKKVPWKEVAGLRDKLIHGYFGIEDKIIWKAAKKEAVVLKKLFLEIKKEEK